MKKLLLAFALSFLLFVQAAPAHADFEPAVQTSLQDMELIAVGTVREIIGPDRFKLDKGGTYMLDGIRVPLSFDNVVASHLKSTLLNQKVGLYARKRIDNNYADKYGNTHVHVMTVKAIWTQADLIARGYAYAFSTPDYRDMVIPLYKYERAARAGRLGLWSRPELAVKTEKDNKSLIGSFLVYEGQVRDFRKVKKTIFVLFGRPGTEKDSLKVIMEAPVYDYLQSTYRLGPNNMVGHFIRIRGWVENSNGPTMTISHPEQVEFVDTKQQ